MPASPRRILVADDEETIRRLLEYNLRKVGFEPVLTSNGKEAVAAADDDLACALVDLRMPEADGTAVLAHFRRHHPEVPVLVISAVSQVREAVAAMKQGAFEYVTKPFDLDELLALVASAARMGQALTDSRRLREATTPDTPEVPLAGGSSITRGLAETVAKVAPLDSTVLITGESGVGKGLIARMIHRASRRAAGPFVTVSCPALPRELLESEMFGHEKGAFTGAQQRRIGRVEMAEGGTLFLDEIGDLPLSLQPKLLNFLQDRQFQRLGGSKVLESDVRVIAATNIDLEEKVVSREFREDLFYRLNVIPIAIPPLRERREDLPALCRQVLDRLALVRGIERLEIDAAAQAQLERHRWPGNVRELENVLERASAFCHGGIVRCADLPPTLGQPAVGGATIGRPAGGLDTVVPSVGGMSLEDLERLAICQTVERCRGNKAAAARVLGITEKSIYNKMTRLGLRGLTRGGGVPR